MPRLLQRSGFEVHPAGDAETGLQLFETIGFALVILDISLPCMSGLSLCRLIRAKSEVPILILSGRSDTADKVGGLEAGADDYLSKPFQEAELMARVAALLRRGRVSAVATPPNSEDIVRGPLVINRRSHLTSLAGRPLDLTPLEFNLLRVLAADAGRAFTRLVRQGARPVAGFAPRTGRLRLSPRDSLLNLGALIFTCSEGVVGLGVQHKGRGSFDDGAVTPAVAVWPRILILESSYAFGIGSIVGQTLSSFSPGVASHDPPGAGRAWGGRVEDGDLFARGDATVEFSRSWI